VALLDELRFRHPTILVLEDLHWADDATMDVIRLLARRVEAAPALVIGTFRDDQLDRSHPLRVLIGELSTAPAVFRINLMTLSPSAVAELAGPYDCSTYGDHPSTTLFLEQPPHEQLATAASTITCQPADSTLGRLPLLRHDLAPRAGRHVRILEPQ